MGSKRWRWFFGPKSTAQSKSHVLEKHVRNSSVQEHSSSWRLPFGSSCFDFHALFRCHRCSHRFAHTTVATFRKHRASGLQRVRRLCGPPPEAQPLRSLAAGGAACLTRNGAGFVTFTTCGPPSVSQIWAKTRFLLDKQGCSKILDQQ